MQKMKKNPMISPSRFKQLLPGLTLLLSLQANAFTVSLPRVVLNGTAPTTVVVTGNKTEGALLVKASLTSRVGGGERVSGAMVSPPVARLESEGKNSLKVMVIDPSKFPADRESKFYLAVSGIGSTNPLARNRDQSAVMGGVTMGTGHILKVLYRPAGLPPLSTSTWKALQVTRVPGGVKITNPTPFWVTFGSLNIDGLPAQPMGEGASALSPFGHGLYATRSVAKRKLEWQIINDLGGYDGGQTDIQ